jgi:hypothetical protein
MKTKICSKCGIKKKINDFTNCSQHNDGKDYLCKKCRAKKRKKYYKKNRKII